MERGYYVGMDIHKKYSQVVVMNEKGEVLAEGRLGHDVGRKELREMEAIAGQSKVAIEATASWGWLAEELEGMGMEVHLAHPGGVRLIAESRLKTDKVDARVLAHLLRTGFLPEAYLCPREVREKREMMRYRLGMVRMRTAAKNRIHAQLARLGIEVGQTDLFGKGGREFLRGLELPKMERDHLDGWLEIVEHLDRLIKKATERIERSLAEDPRAEFLTSIPGIGKLLAHTILAEIGEVQRFHSERAFSSYAGLVPTTRQSGKVTRFGGLVKGCNNYLRWALVEAAQVASRCDIQFRARYLRLKKSKGSAVAIAAIAHKMAKIVYTVVKENRPYHRFQHEPLRVGPLPRMVANG